VLTPLFHWNVVRLSALFDTAVERKRATQRVRIKQKIAALGSFMATLKPSGAGGASSSLGVPPDYGVAMTPGGSIQERQSQLSSSASTGTILPPISSASPADSGSGVPSTISVTSPTNTTGLRAILSSVRTSPGGSSTFTSLQQRQTSASGSRPGTSGSIRDKLTVQTTASSTNSNKPRSVGTAATGMFSFGPSTIKTWGGTGGRNA
jgi:hypothetical protein